MTQFTLSLKNNDDNLKQSSGSATDLLNMEFLMMAELRNAVRQIYRVASGLAEVVSRQRLAGLPLAIVIATFLIAPAPANAQGTPEPPQQLCIEGASNCGTTDGANTGASKRWNPGHHLKVQGQPADTDQFSNPSGYQTKVFSSINARMNDDPLIIGVHVGVAWGVMNPTGSTFDWTFMDAVIDLVEASGKRVIFQLQNKSFNDSPGFEAPADLEGQIAQTGSGWISANWRNGTEGFPDVMGRYMAALEAIAIRYDARDGLEMVLPVESAPSFGSFGAPDDYTDEKMVTQLDRMYTAAGGYFKKANFAPNLNTLGGSGTGNKIPELMERVYQLGLMHGGPDAKATYSYLAFEGTASGPVPVMRDYRTLMGAAYAVSEDVLGTGQGDQGLAPSVVITQEQAHKTTHLSWIPGAARGTTTWDDILAAINANPLLHTACPTVYTECSE